MIDGDDLPMKESIQIRGDDLAITYVADHSNLLGDPMKLHRVFNL
jgi:hypothetical protein